MGGRTLILVRHAKAMPDGADRARVLADRGRADAAAAGRWLAKRGLVPEVAIVSPATRAMTTWKLAAAELPAAVEVSVDHRIYDNTLDDLMAAIHGVSDDVGSLAVVGHNPSIQGLSLVLADSADDGRAGPPFGEDFPTSSVAAFELAGPWSQVGHGPARLVAFHVCRG